MNCKQIIGLIIIVAMPMVMLFAMVNDLGLKNAIYGSVIALILTGISGFIGWILARGAA